MILQQQEVWHKEQDLQRMCSDPNANSGYMYLAATCTSTGRQLTTTCTNSGMYLAVTCINPEMYFAANFQIYWTAHKKKIVWISVRRCLFFNPPPHRQFLKIYTSAASAFSKSKSDNCVLWFRWRYPSPSPSLCRLT